MSRSGIIYHRVIGGHIVGRILDGCCGHCVVHGQGWCRFRRRDLGGGRWRLGCVPGEALSRIPVTMAVSGTGGGALLASLAVIPCPIRITIKTITRTIPRAIAAGSIIHFICDHVPDGLYMSVVP